MTIKRLSRGDLPDWIACASGDQEALARLDLRRSLSALSAS